MLWQQELWICMITCCQKKTMVRYAKISTIFAQTYFLNGWRVQLSNINSWASLKIVPLYSQKLWICMITSVKLDADQPRNEWSGNRHLTSWSVPLDNHPTGISTTKKNVWVTLKVPQIGLPPAPVWYFLSGVYPPVIKLWRAENPPFIDDFPIQSFI